MCFQIFVPRIFPFRNVYEVSSIVRFYSCTSPLPQSIVPSIHTYTFCCKIVDIDHQIKASCPKVVYFLGFSNIFCIVRISFRALNIVDNTTVKMLLSLPLILTLAICEVSCGRQFSSYDSQQDSQDANVRSGSGDPSVASAFCDCFNGRTGRGVSKTTICSN